MVLLLLLMPVMDPSRAGHGVALGLMSLCGGGKKVVHRVE